MNAGILQRSRRWLMALVLVVVLTLIGLSAPVLADLVGLSVAPIALACQGNGSGCG